jgi:hypothetical protein
MFHEEFIEHVLAEIGRAENAASKRVGGSRRQAQIQRKSSKQHEAGSIPSH